MARIDVLLEEQRSARWRLLNTIAELRYLCDVASASVVSGHPLSADGLRVKALAVNEASQMWHATSLAVSAALNGGAR